MRRRYEAGTRACAAGDRWSCLAGLALALSTACSPSPAASAATTPDAAAADGSALDVAVLDASAVAATDAAATTDATTDVTANATTDADAEAVDSDTATTLAPDPGPKGPMQPTPGELSIHQLDLPMGLVPKLGEAAIIIGPTGSVTLLDVGNTKHDDEVRAAVVELNTKLLTPARGYPRQRGAHEVDHIVLTHNHGDHIGAVGGLLEGKEALEVTGAIVHRGDVDLGAGANLERWAALCGLLRGAYKGHAVALCAAGSLPKCDAKPGGAFPAVHCDGLLAGDLQDPGDDDAAAPAYLALGGGARLVFIAADARCTGAAGPVAAAAFGHDDSNEENARSLVGIIEHGAFRYHFGGDLTGSGEAGEPDVESHLAQTSAGRFWQSEGVDVVHAHHHARKTSSNVALVGALAPADGRSRNVVAGINRAYLGSPNDAVVARWTAKGRLGAGRMWVTASPVGGASSNDFSALVVAEGEVRVRTFAGGDGYRVQAIGDGSTLSLPFASLRSCKSLLP
jgi:hypothetical protein